MPDQTNEAGLARRIMRRIPGARPLVRRLVAIRYSETLLRQAEEHHAVVQAVRAEAEAAHAEAEAARAAAHAVHVAAEEKHAAGEALALRAGEQLQAFEQLREEAAALRMTLRTTERERQAALERADLQATLGFNLMRGMDGLSTGLASEIHAARYVVTQELKGLETQILASRASLEGSIRNLALGQRSAGGQAAILYMDLLEASLTGSLSEDGSMAPWTAASYDPARRAIGRDWPATACTMIGTARMRNLRHLLERALAEDVPGDFIETGVWRGGACIYARGILAAHGDATRRVFVADSFRGLPEPDAEAFPADAGDEHSTFQQLAISRDQVADNFRRYGLLDERVVFLEGWFKDTLPKAPIERLAVLRLDGDMYESTIQALDALYDKVSPGGYVIVDDYILGPCARAIEDFRAARGITAALEPVDGAAVWWQVPR